ncbi:hypothetical protein P8452_41747 [Trifolium repens]|nr:hypothetical protein P8452_41747 [Trifolium repens]
MHLKKWKFLGCLNILLQIRFCLVKISIEAAMEGTLHSQQLCWNCHRQAHTTGTSSRERLENKYNPTQNCYVHKSSIWQCYNGKRDEAKKSSVDVSYLILCTQSSDIRYDTTLTLICL